MFTRNRAVLERIHARQLQYARDDRASGSPASLEEAEKHERVAKVIASVIADVFPRDPRVPNTLERL
jgi:hypothetical protein